MANSGTKFDGGRELELLRQQSPLLGSLLQRFIDAHNRGMTNAGVSSSGELPEPSPVDSTEVKGTLTNNILTAPGEILHFVHTHNVPLQRGIRYVTEIDTDPSFPNPHQVDTGSSRSGFVHLPANGDDTHAVPYYLRVTPQYHGSRPGKPTVYGGLQGPTQILMTGSTNMSLLPSQLGGTAAPGQGGKGLGPVQSRGPIGAPKRLLNRN